MATTWSTAYSAGTLLSADNNNFGNNTVRFGIPGTLLSNTGQSFVRITFRSSNSAALALDAFYIGQRADAGDYYDFQSAPTQITFNNGSSGFSIGTNAAATSDTVSFSIPTGKELIIAFYGTSTTNDGLRISAALSGYPGTAYYKTGNDVTTQNATGYTPYGAYNMGVTLIEAGIDVNAFTPMVIFAD